MIFLIPIIATPSLLWKSLQILSRQVIVSYSGSFFFLSPRFQFVLRAEDISSFHGWRRILILSFNKSSLDSRPDSFTPANLKGNFKASKMLKEFHWHIISWFSLAGYAMIGTQGRIPQPAFCSTAHNLALKHMTIRNNCQFPETFWIWLDNNHP